MKFEWRKQEKNLYLPKEEPTLIEIPKQKYLMISGQGDPNGEEYAEKVGALFSLAYAVKMLIKEEYSSEEYYDYTVYPLEGVWDLTEKGRQAKELLKDEFIYTIMIRQPDFVTSEIVSNALEIVKKKKPNPLLDEILFDTMEDGLSVQMMHVGPYDDEPNTFKVMKKFIKENGLEISTLKHREIYLSDARKTEKEKLKTVLRYKVSYSVNK